MPVPQPHPYIATILIDVMFILLQFDLHFPNGKQCWMFFFHVFVGCLCILLAKKPIQILSVLPIFFNSVAFLLSSLYIPVPRALSDPWLTNVSSHNVRCFFIWTVFFHIQKSYSFVEFSFSLLLLHALQHHFEESVANPEILKINACVFLL